MGRLRSGSNPFRGRLLLGVDARPSAAERCQNIVRGAKAGFDRTIDKPAPSICTIGTGEEKVSLASLQGLEIFRHLIWFIPAPGAV